MAGQRTYYHDFLKDLKSSGVRSCYVFSGVENFLKEEAIQLLIKCTLFEKEREYGVEKLQAGGSITGRYVADLANTMPFFSKRRLIIVRNVNAWKEKDIEFIEEYLQRPSPTTFLVLASSEEKLEMGIWKNILRVQYHVEFWPPFDNQMEDWVLGRFAENKKSISLGGLHLLLEYVGKNLTDLDREIKKILQYLGDDFEVTADIVKKILSPTRENNVFELIDAIEERHVPHALKILDKLLADRTKPEEIIPLLSWKFRKYLWALTEKEAGNVTAADEIIYSFKNAKARDSFINKLHQYKLDSVVFIIKEMNKFERYLMSGGKNWKYFLNLLIIKMCVWKEI